MNYYCFIAGMADVKIDNQKSAPEMQLMLNELQEVLTKGDMALLNLLRMEYDNQNIIKYIANTDAELNALGTLTSNDLAELTTNIDNGDIENIENDSRFAKYLIELYSEYSNDKGTEKIESLEDRLAALYYEYGMECKNSFVKSWFEFNLNINNIITALTCRKHEWDIKSKIVGDNDIANTIRNSTSVRDFNMKGSFDYFDQVMAIFETPNLLDRERRIDALKWEWLEDKTFFNHFSIERILAFWLRCQLIHRWDNLSMEEGAEIFRSIINELKGGIKF